MKYSITIRKPKRTISQRKQSQNGRNAVESHKVNSLIAVDFAGEQLTNSMAITNKNPCQTAGLRRF